jgi:uncharacterized membrane protein (DUF441 family)
MEIFSNPAAAAILIPIVTGLTQKIKVETDRVQGITAVAVSLLLGVVGAFLFALHEHNDSLIEAAGVALFEGVFIGLAASGLYSGVNTTIKKVEPDPIPDSTVKQK